MAFTHTYRVRIGPWGLVARISLDVEHVETPPPEAHAIGDSPVWWVPPPGIVPADEEWMRFGLGLAADRLDALRPGPGVVVVRVLAWEVPMLPDYQEEMAAAAVVECLREHYGIAGVDVGLTFDRERNRYEFAWPGERADDTSSDSQIPLSPPAELDAEDGPGGRLRTQDLTPRTPGICWSACEERYEHVRTGLVQEQLQQRQPG